jgi:hypothetical protein
MFPNTKKTFKGNSLRYPSDVVRAATIAWYALWMQHLKKQNGEEKARYGRTLTLKNHPERAAASLTTVEKQNHVLLCPSTTRTSLKNLFSSIRAQKGIVIVERVGRMYQVIQVLCTVPGIRCSYSTRYFHNNDSKYRPRNLRRISEMVMIGVTQQDASTEFLTQSKAGPM